VVAVKEAKIGTSNDKKPIAPAIQAFHDGCSLGRHGFSSCVLFASMLIKRENIEVGCGENKLS
jgi:hypothetical protein